MTVVRKVVLGKLLTLTSGEAATHFWLATHSHKTVFPVLVSSEGRSAAAPLTPATTTTAADLVYETWRVRPSHEREGAREAAAAAVVFTLSLIFLLLLVAVLSGLADSKCPVVIRYAGGRPVVSVFV